jgi:hypothetical protein
MFYMKTQYVLPQNTVCFYRKGCTFLLMLKFSILNGQLYF